MLDYGDDESGLFLKYLRRGSGYYIDVGASELVASGDIKLAPGVEVVRLTETGVVLSTAPNCRPTSLSMPPGMGR